MVHFAEKLGKSLKCPSRPDKNHHRKNGKTLPASLNDFRASISSFLKDTFSKQGKHPLSLSMPCFRNLFDLINFANRAFLKLTTEIEYPTSQWGSKATHEYLTYTLSFLQMLNSITSIVSHLNQAKVSISRALGLIEKNSPKTAANYMKKISGTKVSNIRGKGLLDAEGQSTGGIEKKPDCDKKERVVLEALTVMKKVGFFALGLVMSGLCEDKKMCREVWVFSGDAFKMVLDLGFGEEVNVAVMEIGGPIEEVKGVNRAIERVSEGLLKHGGKIDGESVKELKERLKVLENCVGFVDREVNALFCEALDGRSMVLDNIRSIGQKS